MLFFSPEKIIQSHQSKEGENEKLKYDKNLSNRWRDWWPLREMEKMENRLKKLSDTCLHHLTKD